MLYLLDANALINAHKTWYALKRVPEFWRWIAHHAAAGAVKMPAEIYAEVETGNDELAAWMKEAAQRRELRLAEHSDPGRVRSVLAAYGDGLTDADMIKIGQDPFLVAAALGHADRCVVTAEVPKPTKQRANRKVPDICDDCGVVWRTPIELIEELDFSTTWDLA